RTTLRMLSRLSLTLSGTQLGVTVISLVLALVAEPTVARIVHNHALAVALDLAVVTVLQMLIGELVPKGIGVASPVRVSLALSLHSGYSRFPIVGNDLDDVIGVVHAKDALRIQPEDRPTTPVTELASPATFIPEGRDLESLLTEMRANAVQMAVVADEYGGV